MTVLHTEDGVAVKATNRLPIELYGPTGQPLFPAARLAADGLALPTAPDVLATLLGYDGTALRLVRTGGATFPGAVQIAPASSAGSVGDANAASQTLLRDLSGNFVNVGAIKRLFNESTWDRERNNTEATLLASAARTATVSSADQTNYNGRGVTVFVNVTSAGTGSITVSVEVKDPVSGAYQAVLTSAAITANGLTRLRVHPSLAAAANLASNDLLARTWRVTVTHNNANSISYSVGASTQL